MQNWRTNAFWLIIKLLYWHIVIEAHDKLLENPEVDLNLHDKMTLDKDTKAIHWGGGEINPDPFLTLYKKTNKSEVDKRPKYKSLKHKVQKKI